MSPSASCPQHHSWRPGNRSSPAHRPDRRALPQLGDYVIVVDGAYKPRCIWQTTEVTIKPLIEVDEAFAWDEGESDRTCTSWLNGHRRYFARQASRESFAIDDQIPTVFERFKVVWPIDAADRG